MHKLVLYFNIRFLRATCIMNKFSIFQLPPRFMMYSVVRGNTEYLAIVSTREKKARTPYSTDTFDCTDIRVVEATTLNPHDFSGVLLLWMPVLSLGVMVHKICDFVTMIKILNARILFWKKQQRRIRLWRIQKMTKT